jgi:hypothetical protein
MSSNILIKARELPPVVDELAIPPRRRGIPLGVWERSFKFRSFEGRCRAIGAAAPYVNNG